MHTETRRPRPRMEPRTTTCPVPVQPFTYTGFEAGAL